MVRAAAGGGMGAAGAGGGLMATGGAATGAGACTSVSFCPAGRSVGSPAPAAS
jgi:hypothetical protein